MATVSTSGDVGPVGVPASLRRAFAGPAGRALEFAAAAHGSQRYGQHPYAFHLIEVMRALRHFGFSSDRHLIVGALHDTLEDTSLPPHVLSARFGEDVLAAVQELTRVKDKPFAEHIATMSLLAFEVKLADRWANVGNFVLAEPNERPRLLGRTGPRYCLELEVLAARAKTHGAIHVRIADDIARRLHAGMAYLRVA